MCVLIVRFSSFFSFFVLFRLLFTNHKGGVDEDIMVCTLPPGKYGVHGADPMYQGSIKLTR